MADFSVNCRCCTIFAASVTCLFAGIQSAMEQRTKKMTIRRRVRRKIPKNVFRQFIRSALLAGKIGS
jgi:hypothetical protein